MRYRLTVLIIVLTAVILLNACSLTEQPDGNALPRETVEVPSESTFPSTAETEAPQEEPPAESGEGPEGLPTPAL